LWQIELNTNTNEEFSLELAQFSSRRPRRPHEVFTLSISWLINFPEAQQQMQENCEN
jgi:hypothetical protein